MKKINFSSILSIHYEYFITFSLFIFLFYICAFFLPKKKISNQVKILKISCVVTKASFCLLKPLFFHFIYIYIRAFSLNLYYFFEIFFVKLQRSTKRSRLFFQLRRLKRKTVSSWRFRPADR